MMIAAALLLAGFQSVAFAVCAKIFAIGEGLLPSDRRLEKWLRWCRLETGLAAGALLLAGGFGLTASAVWHWSHAGFGDLAYAQNLRRLIPAGTLIALGAQVVLTSFFLSLLGLRTIRRTPPGGGNEPR
ncbi:MAG: glycosyltransferase family 2 protein, partial [Verrucomicrobia bacterium]|nr:glycosyltransferase family 2 protein [Verrucomicrobiota bacterium]